MAFGFSLFFQLLIPLVSSSHGLCGSSNSFFNHFVGELHSKVFYSFEFYVISFSSYVMLESIICLFL